MRFLSGLRPRFFFGSLLLLLPVLSLVFFPGSNVKAASSFDNVVRTAESARLANSSDSCDEDVSLTWAGDIVENESLYTGNPFAPSYSTAMTNWDNKEFWGVTQRYDDAATSEYQLIIWWTTDTTATAEFYMDGPDPILWVHTTSGALTYLYVTIADGGSGCEPHIQGGNTTGEQYVGIATEDNLPLADLRIFFAFVYDVDYPSGYEGLIVPDSWSPPVDYAPQYDNFSYFNGITSFRISPAQAPTPEEANGVRVSYSWCDEAGDSHYRTIGDFSFGDTVSTSMPYFYQPDADCVGPPPNDYRPYHISILFLLDGSVVTDEGWNTTEIWIVPTEQTNFIGTPDTCSGLGDYATCILGDVNSCDEASGWRAFVCPIISITSSTTTGRLLITFVPLFTAFFVPNGMTTCPSISFGENPSYAGHEFDVSSLPTQICTWSDNFIETIPIAAVIANFVIALLALGLLFRLVNSLFNNDTDIIEDTNNRNQSE